MSRLNRAHPQKHDAFVLDFMNDTETIRASFDTFYRTTILSDETDPNRLHDLKPRWTVIKSTIRHKLTYSLDCTFRGLTAISSIPSSTLASQPTMTTLTKMARSTSRARQRPSCEPTPSSPRSFLMQMPIGKKLSILLSFLLPKLPAPREEDLSQGILESVDMDSYRIEKQAVQRVQLTDQDAEIDPVPTEGGGHRTEPELERLSNIIRSFNDLFGNITWADTDRIRRLISTEIPERVAANAAYQNAKQNSDKQNARIEHDKALAGVIVGLMKDDTELFKQFSDNPEFKRWLTDTIFSATYERPTPHAL